MQKNLLMTGILVFLFACASEKVNFSQLQDRNGVYYLINKDKPFTGDVVQYNNGKVEMEGRIENGLREGMWVTSYPSGQKKMEGNYKEGLKDGTWTYWSENGQQQAQEMYKYGKLLSNEGTLNDTVASDTVVPVEKAVVSHRPAKPAAVNAPAPKVERKQAPVEWSNLKGGPVKYYNGVPYTGPVVKYQRNGLKELDGYFEGGKRSGRWTFYDIHGNVKYDKFY
jgi:antitoxin component YwqK of YwqJK toxin-antitoxin module